LKYHYEDDEHCINKQVEVHRERHALWIYG